MDINLDHLFLTKDSFEDFRDISKNISTEKVNIFIREAQVVEARAFLGKELYNLMQNDWNIGTGEFDDPIYNHLWFGTEYNNIKFNGYANAVVYFAYYRFLLQQQTNISRFGVESVQNEISEDITDAQIRIKSKDSLQIAFTYQNDTKEFLCDNKSIYPTWKESKKAKKQSYNFFKL